MRTFSCQWIKEKGVENSKNVIFFILSFRFASNFLNSTANVSCSRLLDEASKLAVHSHTVYQTVIVGLQLRETTESSYEALMRSSSKNIHQASMAVLAASSLRESESGVDLAIHKVDLTQVLEREGLFYVFLSGRGQIVESHWTISKFFVDCIVFFSVLNRGLSERKLALIGLHKDQIYGRVVSFEVLSSENGLKQFTMVISLDENCTTLWSDDPEEAETVPIIDNERNWTEVVKGGLEKNSQLFIKMLDHSTFDVLINGKSDDEDWIMVCGWTFCLKC